MGVRIACCSPADDSLPHIPIKRLGPSGFFRAVVLSDGPFECWTHFIRGRTLPCIDVRCPGCEKRLAMRYQSYLAVTEIETRKRFILILTEGATRMLKSGLDESGSMRGRCVLFSRTGKRENGKIIAEYQEGLVPMERLGQPVPLEAHLSRIWQIEGTHLSADLEGFEDALRRFTGAIVDPGPGEDPDARRLA